MSKIYVISDLHLGHVNLSVYRGFSSIEAHDEHIISNWNNTVTKKDVVYVLGDITMEKNLYSLYLPQLKGVKKVILGNHDMPQHVQFLLPYVNSVAGMFDYKGGTLTHCPIHPMELQKGRFLFNIHGHLHGEIVDDDRYICVSCETVNYTPILMSTLISKYDKRDNTSTD